MTKWGWRRKLAFALLICIVTVATGYVDYAVKRAIARDVVRSMVRPSALNEQTTGDEQHETDN